MAKIPDAELIRLTIVEVDSAIELERARIRVFAEQHPNFSHQDMLGKQKRLYNLLERRHMLEMMKTYPRVKVYYQVEFVSIRDADGKEIKIPKEYRRIADGGLMGDKLKLVEVKKESEFLKSFPKGKEKVAEAFLKSSAAGKEIASEKGALKWASKRGVVLWVEVKDPLTMLPDEFGIPIEDVGISMVQSYLVMGDGIEASLLYRTRAPKAGGPSGGSKAPSPVADVAHPSTPKVSEVKEVIKPAMDRAATESKTIENRGLPEPTRTPFLEVTDPKTGPKSSQTGLDKVTKLLPNTVALKSPLANQAAMAGAVEGAAGLIFSGLLEAINSEARKKAEEELRQVRLPEAAYWNSRGEWVIIMVTYLQPITIDMTGFSPDFVEFWSTSLIHAPPYAKDVDEETQRFHMLQKASFTHQATIQTEAQRKAPDRKIPPYYHLYPTEYAILPPDLQPDQILNLVGPGRATKATVLDPRGITGRCTRQD